LCVQRRRELCKFPKRQKAPFGNAVVIPDPIIRAFAAQQTTSQTLRRHAVQKQASKPGFDLPMAAFLPLGDSNQLAVSALKMPTTMAKTLLRYQVEGLSFLQHRFQRDIKLMDDIIAAEKTNDTFDVISDYWHNTASDYAKEVSKTLAINARFASDAAGVVREEVKNSLNAAAASTIAP
jgi:hypothetical protein